MKWEYKLIDFDILGKWGGSVDKQEIMDVLNQMGSEGWEAISSTTTAAVNGKSRKIVYTLKRELNN